MNNILRNYKLKNMSDKKILLICTSVHHGNTLKVAEAMGEVLGAQIKKPSEVKIEELAGYDLIGFGSGIYNGKHHRSLFELLEKIENGNGQKVFIFSTATIEVAVLHKEFRQAVLAKGFELVGEFQCRGFIDYGFLKFFGGIGKGRPNANDLQRARDFAKGLQK